MLEVSIVSADAIRGYVRTLRQLRKVSQPKLAEAIGMAVRTYKDWELGTTKGIDAEYLLRAVKYLHGELNQLSSLLDSATAEDGATLAREVIETLAPIPVETPQEESRMDRLLRLLADGLSPQEAARRTLHQP